VLVELPGTGGTPLPDPFSLEAVAAALDRVLAGQDADSTILLANGMGGLVALLEIQAHPERARGLMVLDAAAKPPFQLDSAQTRLFLDFIDRNYDGFLEITYGRMGNDSAQNAMILGQARSVPPATIKAYVQAAMNADGAKGLPAMKTPFLFVATGRILGTDDWPTTARAIGYDDPAQVPVRLMPGVGYLVMRDQPDSLAAVVREFEAKVGAKP
jgi:pimeloyl-ACP methyl ester carboxylesterase